MSGLRQGTVKEWNGTSREGTVLLDDGTEIPIDAASLDPRMLMLRLGQRVAFVLAEERGVLKARDLKLVTLA